MPPREKILVVDQDPSTSRAILIVLSSAGFDAEEAKDMQSAQEVALRGVDLVVIDLMLEGRAGVSLCEALRREEATKDVPVLFISAAGDNQAQRAAIEAGGDDFLSKPIHRGELLLRIRSLLQFRRMQRELANKNQLLMEQRDALLRLQRQKEELTEIVVHDLKNPLAAIAANAAFLNMAGEMNEDTRECAGAIARAADNMLRMVHDILDVSRAEEAGLNLKLEQIDLSELAGRAAGLMARRAEERRVSLALENTASGLSLRADPDLMRRVIENLLDNAIRYTPSGGQVALTLADLGQALSLSVADGGPGIPEHERARIFEKYAQLERKDDKAQKRFGRGIGLSFVKMVVDAHGGQIRVLDNPPRGARFELIFPKVS
jgi:two-component system, sensor histidine kinase and response regulator